MQDNEKLVERLRDLGIHSADIAATTIEAQAREIAELRANEKHTDGQVRQWRRIANAMGYEPDVVTAKDEKPLPNWLLVRIAMFRQRVIDEAAQGITAEVDTLRTQLTETQARLAEAVGLLRDICENTYVGQHHKPVSERSKYGNYLAKYYHRARAFLSKQEGA